MRKRTGIAFVAAACIGAFAWAPESEAGPPEITSIMESRDTHAARVVITLFGRGISRFTRYHVMSRDDATEFGDAEILTRNASMAILRLPSNVGYGKWRLHMLYGRKPFSIGFEIEQGLTPVASLTRAAFSAEALQDLDDATTVAGLSINQIAVKGQVLPLSGGALTGGITVAGAVMATEPGNPAVACGGAATSLTGYTAGVFGESHSPDGVGVHGIGYATTGNAYGVYAQTQSSAGVAMFGSASSATGTTYGALGTTASTAGVGVRGSALAGTGTAWGVWGDSSAANGVGVHATSFGTGAASAALVADHAGTAGDVAVFRAAGANVARIDRSGKGCFDGGTQTGGADFAESVEVDRPKAEFEPGDVMVIDPNGTRRFALSREAETTLVAGVYATKPGVLARPASVAGSTDWEATEAPMAITGIVPCNVCDEGGAVRAGDLLVAASIPGHAKKAGPSPKPGTLIGKALARLDGARGKIEILLSMR